jgi:hypothetical protein
MSQHKMVTFVNGNVLPVADAEAGRAGVHVRGQQNDIADYSAEPRGIWEHGTCCLVRANTLPKDINREAGVRM